MKFKSHNEIITIFLSEKFFISRHCTVRGVLGHLLQTISNFSSKRPIDESAKRNWTNSVFTPGLWDGTGTVPFHTLSVQPSPCRINCKIKPWRAKCIKKLEYVSNLEIRRNGTDLRECRKPFSRWRQVISRFVQHCYHVANYLQLKQKIGFLFLKLFVVLSKN